MKQACLLVGHGTVESTSELPGFLKNIRRGHAPPPELLAEITHRYEAIGHSPLNRICTALAAKLETKIGMTTRYAARLWKPSVFDVLEQLIDEGTTHLTVIPLAQFSSYVYASHVQQCMDGIAQCRATGGHLTPTVSIRTVENWGHRADLTRAFAGKVRAAHDAASGSSEGGAAPLVIFTAHSLPKSVIASGDPYDKEVLRSAELVAGEAGLASWELCFQSQGMSSGPGGRPMEWLGPDLRDALTRAKARGHETIVLAPIGFLADHVEILYDLDIEAMGWAKELGIKLSRTESLNTDDSLVEVLAQLVKSTLD